MAGQGHPVEKVEIQLSPFATIRTCCLGEEMYTLTSPQAIEEIREPSPKR
jgi:hypothetical protein